MDTFKHFGHRIKGTTESGKLSSNRKTDSAKASQRKDHIADANPEPDRRLELRKEENQVGSGASIRRTGSTNASASPRYTPQYPPRPIVGANTGKQPENQLCMTKSATQNLQASTREGFVKDGTISQQRALTTATTDSKVAREDLFRLMTQFMDRGEQLEHDIAERNTQLQQLEGCLHDLELSLKKSQLKAEDLQAENAKLRHGWNQATVALGRAQLQNANYKVDDAAILGQYQELIFDVSSWASTYCATDLNKSLSDSDVVHLRSITMAPELYLRLKRSQPLLLRSLLMKMLVDTILSVGPEQGMWWAGSCNQGMRSMYLTLQPAEPNVIPSLLQTEALRLTDVKAFSQWKAKSAILLSERDEEAAVDININMLLRSWQQTLAPYVQNNKAVWIDLEDIIRKAVELDRELNKSRALFVVQRWSVDMMTTLDPRIFETPMEFQEAHAGLKVELVLAPCITKTGNADGDAFESMSHISKWVVVGSENREMMKKQRG
ncbi:hypothetical protein C7974DRAFT_190544 [Boeremia exigua]|uniref:uncharacterized protein n=1 Tax=Boeremia exigua TaxID=749465 RepID=UPI001E8E5F0C|nr:uncharacterized protein C7974DRAFT_190544 [Boeremia exigua]KAH6629647.1 hypothetical protein C7974DRAFT_190544 [Boeremia exigua]